MIHAMIQRMREEKDAYDQTAGKLPGDARGAEPADPPAAGQPEPAGLRRADQAHPQAT
ncbi:MAG: hypothetical protein MZV65_12805 [Chromatiales bacterium]|nr:hypothetical protein [Chromatiales bacterium]